ncbi:opacity protein-like surface antigen [Neorhizobium sp. 2083]|uniref:outer membrane protein n=1 Tax=Neorhizobium sp. 2083 TaxID=2817762 RepID=UPI00285972F3|nr:porin family protein [Neorhizobium sp. 2083]MDR6816896.1 opacity protein-like surface antigen [Neorhizobium sp. 2083]
MRKLLASAFALTLTVSAANSADLYQPQPEPYQDAPEVTVQEATGWYLRGDVGYSFKKSRGTEFYQGTGAPGVALAEFDRSDLRDAFTLGGGVGYQINSYLRTDVTLDYMFDSKFRGSTHGSCGAGPVCTSTDLAALHAYSLMANAYVDLGTYGYFTPYVGAGIGGTYVKWSNLRNTSCDDAGAGCDAEVSHGGEKSWRFTYALMAGASIDITCNVKADVGYRFRQVAGGDMFGLASGGGPGRDKGFYSHEARVGARYIFGGCDTPPAYEPPPQPIVYK